MRNRLLILAGILLVCCVAYLTVGARGNWDFVLAFRSQKLVALLLVGGAISVSTVVFQTITGNRILTPSIMGFDALYLLILSALVLAFGGYGYSALDPMLMMVLNVILLCGGALLLFGTLLRTGEGDIMRMILTGVVLAVMFRSVTSFILRVIDPNEYAVVQASSFARFSRVDVELMGLALLLCAGTFWAIWRLRFRLDVLALGKVAATSLGEDMLKGQRVALLLISILVSVSTALVGPVAFFGLLVTSMTYVILPTYRHAVLLPGAVMMSGIVLVGGQTVMERVLKLSTPLSVVVEFAGGLVFLILLLRSFK